MEAPDPYAGDVRDLMSQKPFVWNGNNPVEFNDPSGYCPNGAAWGLAGPLVVGVWCAIDNISTLVDSRASAGDKTNAGLTLAGLIPAVRLEEIGVSIVERFGGAGRMALNNLSSGGKKDSKVALKT